MAQQLEDFDFEATCHTLGASASAASQEVRDANEIAGYALHYLFATGQFADFRDYLRIARQPIQSEIRSEHVFDDMEQAEQWLNSQPSPEWGMLINIAGRAYTVAKRAVTRLVLLPSIVPAESKPPNR